MLVRQAMAAPVAPRMVPVLQGRRSMSVKGIPAQDQKWCVSCKSAHARCHARCHVDSGREGAPAAPGTRGWCAS